MNSYSNIALKAIFVLLLPAYAFSQEDLQKRIDDKNGVRTDVWVYNDIQKAMDQARLENKPLFVTFRCVPCKACASFDAEVANGSEKVRALAKEKFISVRQVEMKNVDLSLFQFDHDLNWAAMFIHPDGTVYARYGTQSAEGPDAYNSIEGLLNTMHQVLDLHKEYPRNIADLVGKRGSKKKGTTALKMDGLRNAKQLEQQTTRANCIHCHMIHDAENFAAQESGKVDRDLLWRYPLPENLGLKMDRTKGNVVSKVLPKSAADRAGLRPGDKLTRLNGQRIVSIADIQWVLHGVPNQPVTIKVETQRGKKSLELNKGWKEYDISWRGSLWSLSPRLRVWAPNLEPARLKQLKINEDNTAFLVRWINRRDPGGKSAFKSGLREGDVIVELEGKPIRRMTSPQFNAHIKLNYKVGQSLPIVVLRKGKRIPLEIQLVE